MRQVGLFKILVVALLGFVLVGGLVLSDKPAAASEVAVSVSNDSAQPDFPNSITFNLSAESASPTESVELLYSIAGEETLHMSTPAFTPGTSVQVTDSIDMQINQVPPGVDITYHWKLTGADGSTFETEPTAMLWKDDRYDWKEVSNDHVSVYAYNGNEKFNRSILDSAQRTIDKVQKEFGVELDTPIRIWAYQSQKDFQGALFANSEEWSVGATFPQLNLIVATLPEGDDYSVGRVVPHEVTHQVLYQATKNPFNSPPRWLDEGLAVLHQEQGKEEYADYVDAAAKEGRLYSVRALNSDFPYDPDDVHLAYAESLSIVQFIIDHFGSDKMGALIAAYRQGLSHDEAAMQALGVDLGGLDKLWKESLGYKGDKGTAGFVQPDGVGPNSSFAGALAYGSGVIALAIVGSIGIGILVNHRSNRGATDRL
jgi:hypothetical protein